MGLKQALGATLTTVLADQWREYFYCESLPENVLMRKGVKRVSGKSSNTKGSDNIISNGSIIAVNDGQCMMIVDQGGIVEFTAQPGEFVWDKSTEPSIFAGKLGEGIKNVFKQIGKRFTYGGEAPKDQRIYYFNGSTIPTSTWTPRSASAASANTPTSSPTPCCSIRTWPPTSPATTPGIGSTASSRASF